MKTQIADLAGLVFVLALSIVLPVVAGAEIERHGVTIDLARPAILA